MYSVTPESGVQTFVTQWEIGQFNYYRIVHI